MSSLSSDTTTTEEEEEEARIELEEARTELEAARKEMKNAIVAERELLALPPSDDEGLVELPSDDCDDGGASSSQGMAKRRRLWTAIRNPRRDRPSDVIPGPSAGDSLAAGNIDLPEEVANDELDDLLEDVTTATPKKEDVATDELDDLFVDVKTASPKKEDRSLAKTLRGKKKHFRVSPGPTAAEIQARLMQGRAPDVKAWLGRSLGGALQDDVMEVFSPPRILEHTATLGLRGDLSADLATGWDLSLEQHRANLLTEIVRRRPKIVFLEPPCTWFSKLLSYNWQHIPRHLREQRLAASMVLFEFSLLIMRIQLLAGRTFVLEHPHGATSWKHPQVQDALRRFPGTDFADFDFCMFGMVSKINRVPVKKPTRLMTNCKHIYSRFAGVRCDGSHDHIMCCDSEGGEKRSKYAQYYPRPFCACVAKCCVDFCRNIPC